MPYWTPIHDLIFAVLPPVEIPLPLFCVFVVLAGAVLAEVRAWRRLR